MTIHLVARLEISLELNEETRSGTVTMKATTGDGADAVEDLQRFAFIGAARIHMRNRPQELARRLGIALYDRAYNMHPPRP